MTSSRTWTLMAASLVVIVLFFVLREHWGHALGFLPYLVLLACPVMHLFLVGMAITEVLRTKKNELRVLGQLRGSHPGLGRGPLRLS